MRLRIIAAALCVFATLTACGSEPVARPTPPPYTASERASVDPGSPILPPRPAPPFTLVDQFGDPVSLQQFRGKVVLLAFVDPQCTNICPLTTATMVGAVALLGRHAADVVLLGIAANPLHHSVADVAKYSLLHGLSHRWLFLTGPLHQLEAVWKAYGIEVQVLHGAIDHTPALFLIDARGRERRVWLTSADYGVLPLESSAVARAVAQVLPGHPVPHSPKAPPGPAPLSPASRLTLPPLFGHGQPIELGSGRSHLLVFFASWVPGITAALTALNAYAATARQEHLPPVAAVDVLPIDVSPPRLRSILRSVHLLYPLVVDPSGRVADAYGVQDMPWLVLVSARGRIVWHHDGWLSNPELVSQVVRHASGPDSAPKE